MTRFTTYNIGNIFFYFVTSIYLTSHPQLLFSAIKNVPIALNVKRTVYGTKSGLLTNLLLCDLRKL